MAPAALVRPSIFERSNITTRWGASSRSRLNTATAQHRQGPLLAYLRRDGCLVTVVWYPGTLRDVPANASVLMWIHPCPFPFAAGSRSPQRATTNRQYWRQTTSTTLSAGSRADDLHLKVSQRGPAHRHMLPVCLQRDLSFFPLSPSRNAGRSFAYKVGDCKEQ